MSGPYETREQACAGPFAAEALRLDPDDQSQAVTELAYQHLLAATEAAGIELGAFDVEVLEWFAAEMAPHVQVLLGLFERFHAAGRATPPPFDLGTFTAETTTRVRWICDTDRRLHREPVGPAWCAVALVLGDDDWLTEHAGGVDTAVGSVCQHTGMTPVQLGNWIGGIRDVVIKGGAS